jgi:hypothetical protein
MREGTLWQATIYFELEYCWWDKGRYYIFVSRAKKMQN